MPASISHIVPAVDVVSLCLGLLIAAFAWFVVRPSKDPLPPGPPRVPLLGNIHQLPPDYQQKMFAEWGRKYGDVVFARLFRTPALILNSVEAAQDLMDKRSAKYSDRPRFVLMAELMGWDAALSLMGYGDRSRRHRKWMHEAFGTKTALETYRPMQQRETYSLLLGLIKSPKDYDANFRRFAASMVMQVAYGHRVTSLNDIYLELAETAISATNATGSPGSMLVDFFPILKYIPTWFPGCTFKQHALDMRLHARAFLDTPFKMVQEAMANGTATPSLASSLIERCSGPRGLTAEDEEDIKGSTAQLYSAGTETMMIVMATFLLAMVLYPDVLKKAQAELDRAVGNDRLPDFSDRESLPYLECILKEAYRWNPPAPLGIPHRVTSDDSYRGYHIPSGSTIIPNIWGMMYDSDVYPEPSTFRPERFLDSTVANPAHAVFGFGRRLCVGQAFADASLWLAMANILATLQIRKAVDNRGNEITPKAIFKSGLTTPPEPFSCSIRPRSAKALDLIEAASAESAR